ncbi:MAG: UDP-4-amino-4,6-dideoxy-N-acetyl-beta-L-altrosamine transaminase [Pseudomonadota bacterium]
MATKPLRYSQQSIDESDIAAVVKVLRSDWLTCGPAVEAFEAALCAYTGAKYAVAVSSGTAALHLAYMVVKDRGERQITTSPLSFVATANAALLAGLQVEFQDVEESTGNVDLPYSLTSVAVPVHFAGRAARIPGESIVIEDGCHALGAMDFDGCARVGSCAHSLACVFSFHPVKPICTGEGGAVTTNDQGFADEVRRLRSHGRDENGCMVALGLNYRMTDIQAALGTSQLERCDEMRERRVQLAERYNDELHTLDWARSRPAHASGSWHLYPVRIKNGKRDAVKAALNAQGIGAQIHYPCIHLQPYYRERFGYHQDMFPEAEAWAAEELSLPLHAKMTEADVARVVDALRKALA